MRLLRKLFESNKNAEHSMPPDLGVQRERRSRERKIIEAPAEMQVGFSDIPERVYIRELSGNGMYVLTMHELRNGLQIEVYMKLPDAFLGSETVHYTATVQRIDEFRNPGVFGVAAVIHRCEILGDIVAKTMSVAHGPGTSCQ